MFYTQSLKRRLLLLIGIIILAGCGNSENFVFTNPVFNTTSAGGVDPVTGNPLPGVPITVDLNESSLTVNKTVAVADNSDQIVATLTARDSDGNPVPGLAVTLAVTGSGNTLSQPAPTDENGLAMATLTSTVAEGKSITATIDGQAIPATAMVEFVPGAPAQLGLRTPPPATENEDVIIPNIVIALEDQFGNTVTGNLTAREIRAQGIPTSVTVSMTPNPVDLSGTLSQDFTNGLATFDDLVVSEPGDKTFTFTAGTLTATADINIVDVPPAGPDQFVFSAQPSGSITAGADNLGDITLQLQDGDGVDLARAGENVTLTVSMGSGALTGTTTRATDSNGLVTFDDLGLSTADTYTLTATAANMAIPNPVTTGTFNIIADSANPQLMFSTQPPASTAVANDFSPEVTVTDPFGNVLTGYGTSLTLSLQNSGASVPTNLALAPAVPSATPSNGVATFSNISVDGDFEMTTANYFLRVSDGAMLNADSSNFSLTSGAPAVLNITSTAPAPTVQPASPFTPNPFSLEVTVEDQFGNTATSSSDTVTLSLDDSGLPGGAQGVAVLGGTTSGTPTNGVVNFSGLTVNKVGDGFVIEAAATGLTGDSTASFNVTIGAGPRTLIVDNVNGMTVANGGTGQANCPLSSLAEAETVASNDADVNIIEVIGTTTPYGGIDLTGTTQTITLRGQGATNPVLGGQVIMENGDTVQNLTITRNNASAALVGTIAGGTVSNVTVNNNAGPGADFDAVSGTLSLTGLTCNTLGTGLDLSGTGNYILNGLSVTTTTGTGIASSGGTLSGTTGSTVSATGGPALSTNNTGLAAAGLVFSSLSSTNSSSTGLNINNMDGSGTFTCSTTTVSNSSNSGVQVANSTANFNLGATTVNSTNMADNSFGINLLTANTGTFTFGNVTCDSDEGGIAVGGSTVAASGGAWTRVNATGGAANTAEPALRFNGTDFSNVTIADVNSGNAESAQPAVELSGNLSGALVVTDLDVTGASGVGFQVAGGSASFTGTFGNGSTVVNPGGTAFSATGGSGTINFNGSVTQNNAQTLVSVGSTTGGSVNIGTATGGASSTGVDINGASGNVAFTNLNLGTSGSRINTNPAVDIDGGTGNVQLGAVSIFTNNLTGVDVATKNTGTVGSASGTVDAGNATTVNVVGPAGLTTLGMTLTRIDSSGGATVGLNLQNTDGSFTVVGDGTANNNGSGGTIANKSGNGVTLTSAVGVNLQRMAISNNGTNGILASDITDFSLVRCNLENNGDAVNEGGLRVDPNILGTSAITNCLISDSAEHNVEIINTSGTLNSLTISGTELSDTDQSPLGADGLLMETQSSAVATLVVEGCTIRDNASDGIQVSALDSSMMSLTITNTDFTSTLDGSSNGSTGARGLTVSSATNSILSFVVNDGGVMGNGNTFTNFSPSLGEEAINVTTLSTSTSSSTMTGTIANNTFSSTGGAIGGDFRGSGTATLLLENNTATTSISREVFDFIFGDTGTNGLTVNLTVRNNDLASLGREALYVDCTNFPLTLNMDIVSNTLVGGPTAGDDDVALFDSTGATFNLVGVAANASTQVQNTNTAAQVTADDATINIVGGPIPTP